MNKLLVCVIITLAILACGVITPISTGGVSAVVLTNTPCPIVGTLPAEVVRAPAGVKGNGK